VKTLKKDLGILPDMLSTMRVVALRPGWVPMRLTTAVRALRQEGYVESNAHGRVRATDDGRAWFYGQGLRED
jgi:hypothetical protein